MNETVQGIEFSKPEVKLMSHGRMDVCEIAGRIAYDSFNNSEHEQIKNFNTEYDFNGEDIEHSELLDSLAWTHFHHSVLEHINISYIIKGTSRGTLVELTRHRIASYTVRSTRYTMSSVINAFVASQFILDGSSIQMFASKIKKLDIFVVQDNDYINIEIEYIYKKLQFQMNKLGKEIFYDIAIAKSSLPYLIKADNYKVDAYELFDLLESGKKKRNVGDAFKHIVTDNFKCDLVVTFNLRSLKNYFQLRDSGAAYFQIQWLAQAMKEVTPSKYLDLIIKKDKE